jgi:hypothetical protein
MTTKLTKAEQTKLAALTSAMDDAALAYNEARNELEAFRSEIHTKISEYVDSKSEAWQESDRGQAIQTWRDAWEEEPGDEAANAPEYPEAAEV